MLVHVPSYTFVAFNAVTAILAYSKVEGDLFFFTWNMTLTPTMVYLLILSILYLKQVIWLDEKTYKESYSIKTNRFQLLDNFFHLVFSLVMLFFVGYAAHFLDAGVKKVSTKPMFAALALYMVVQGVYSYVSKRLENSTILPVTNEKETSSLATAIMTPILNFLGTSFVFCQGGTCSTIYGSTISAIGSAFGISVSEWLPFLDWLTFLLVLVSVGVLYYAKQELTYKPFLLSVFAATIIFADTFVLQMRYPIYLGNVLMIAAALWNSKLNKAGLFAKKKKAPVTPKV